MKDRYQIALQLAKRAGERIPGLPRERNLGERINRQFEQIKHISINEYIAHLTEMTRALQLADLPNLTIKRRSKARLEMYVYLRDNYEGVEKVSDALDKLSNREVPFDKFIIWIDAGCFDEGCCTEYSSLCKGYASLKERAGEPPQSKL